MPYGIWTIIYKMIGVELKFFYMANSEDRQSTKHIIKIWINLSNENPALHVRYFNVAIFHKNDRD